MTGISAAQWQRVKSVLADLLSVPEDARSAELDRACRGDAVLRASVLSLLDAREPERDRVGRLSAALEKALALDEAPERWVGRDLDGYRLTALMGSGGMGVVYRAEPPSGGPPVALKALRTALLSSTARKRFDRERDRLDGLSHPNIARLLGSGVMPEGVPFLVMELVDGDPIDVYADGHRLTVRERLGLILEVGLAVAHAHEHQIIHRDLKPSNILVRPSGEPSLLDFGIAKLLDPLRGGAPATLTLEALAFTPGYASPEQIAGEPVTPASDVYSLGAVGYTLLAGAPPPTTVARGLRTLHRVFGSQGDSRREIARARAASIEELERELCGDLEEIFLRACDLLDTVRYPSVDAFSKDIVRYLESPGAGS